MDQGANNSVHEERESVPEQGPKVDRGLPG
jgi:hypothetical protein